MLAFFLCGIVVLFAKMEESFIKAVNKWKYLRARFDQRQVLKGEFEFFVRFEEETYPLWGLYQQMVVGNINVPKKDYMDPEEKSWMWGWIKGNRKWHAWNKCLGLSKSDAMFLFIEEVRSLERRLPGLLEQWKDEADPRIPDETVWQPEAERENVKEVARKAKLERRERDRIKREEEERGTSEVP
ncbi:hypothetical protein QR680_014302 [Steinernema hermaphroditum]|uniref:ACB domain-containing protein n=1 Tax=Steinernema hermaphroditum TaxID=289476 RepID=A0AA39IAK9_9BILA|nr:hypothetical protein QR680_014302 [Steinernema hermaphroditum]